MLEPDIGVLGPGIGVLEPGIGLPSRSPGRGSPLVIGGQGKAPCAPTPKPSARSTDRGERRRKPPRIPQPFTSTRLATRSSTRGQLASLPPLAKPKPPTPSKRTNHSTMRATSLDQDCNVVTRKASVEHGGVPCARRLGCREAPFDPIHRKRFVVQVTQRVAEEGREASQPLDATATGRRVEVAIRTRSGG